MTTETKPTTEPAAGGWHFPATATCAHFVVNGRSLCRRYRCEAKSGTFGKDATGFAKCAACRRKLAWMEVAKQKAAKPA